MKSAERVDRVSEHLWKAIEYTKHEYDVNYAEMIGILEIIQQDLWHLGCSKEDCDDSSA